VKERTTHSIAICPNIIKETTETFQC